MFDITDSVVSLLGIPQQFDGAAGLTAQSSLTANATGVYKAAAALTAESGLAADGLRIAVCASSLTAASSLSADGLRYAVCAAALSAESSLSAEAIRVEPGASIVIATSDLTAAAIPVRIGAAALTADSALSATATRVALGAASLSADSALTADAHFRIDGATSAMSADLHLYPPTVLPIYRLLDPVVENTLTTNVLIGRYLIEVGQTILITGTTLQTVECPLDVEIRNADFAFLGGHKYQLSQAEYDAFVAAGRPDLVEVA